MYVEFRLLGFYTLCRHSTRFLLSLRKISADVLKKKKKKKHTLNLKYSLNDDNNNVQSLD